MAQSNHMRKAFAIGHMNLKLWANVLILVFIFYRTSSSNTPDVEGEDLVDFLKGLNDSNHRITNWDYHFVSPCFSWSDVSCLDRHVVSLRLASNGFSGTLSPSITKLQYLTNLDLHDNELSGELPEYIGSMLHLQSLILAQNRFSGSIPKSWAQLSNLKHLDLSSNNLTGEIPAQLFTIPTFKLSDKRCCELSVLQRRRLL